MTSNDYSGIQLYMVGSIALYYMGSIAEKRITITSSLSLSLCR